MFVSGSLPLNTPQIYGLPKVHKEGIPLRPIVAAIGLPIHPLAKKLASILAPLSGNTFSHVRNTVDFVEHIQQTHLEEDTCMVSFDVVSLFTKVPLDQALQVIAQRLREDPTLAERTTIPAGDLCSLIQLCFEVTYFQFGEQFYRQAQEAAMGSPLSQVVANLYMEASEQQAPAKFPCKPRLWLRYV